MSLGTTRPADTYSPLYFLASLGAGGVAVTFFMFLVFWVPHPNQPVPVFEDIASAFSGGPFVMQAAIAVAILGIAVFAYLNLKSLIWNLKAFRVFKATEAYATLRQSNAEASLLALPLALAMSVNVLFIIGLVFVPQLWSVVEFLFPLAMIAFAGIGALALKMIGAFLGRVLSIGGAFDLSAHNSFAQLLPAFSIAMVGVGFAAPAAMSTQPGTVATALILSTFFAVVAVVYTLFAAITALVSMLQHGTAREAAPTLTIIVPLITVLGILFMRQSHGLHVVFDVHTQPGEMMLFLTRLLAIQVAFLLLGAVVMLRQGYFTDYVLGSQTSPGSYALVCPAVALSVMVHFFANKGLVDAGAIEKFSVAYWGVTAIALVAQVVAIALLLRLNRQHFAKRNVPNTMVPAE